MTSQAQARLGVEGNRWIWVVEDCPLCHRGHIHMAGLLSSDPRGSLKNHRAAPCEANLSRVTSPKEHAPYGIGYFLDDAWPGDTDLVLAVAETASADYAPGGGKARVISGGAA
jgi:hypothetical protein